MRDQWLFFVYLPKDTAKWGEGNCPHFETAIVGLETRYSRWKVRLSDRRAAV